ncbi:MAG: hypothetical protein RLZZ15_100 [Verrucomicrobiota bacterium]
MVGRFSKPPTARPPHFIALVGAEICGALNLREKCRIRKYSHRFRHPQIGRTPLQTPSPQTLRRDASPTTRLRALRVLRVSPPWLGPKSSCPKSSCLIGSNIVAGRQCRNDSVQSSEPRAESKIKGCAQTVYLRAQDRPPWIGSQLHEPGKTEQSPSAEPPSEPSSLRSSRLCGAKDTTEREKAQSRPRAPPAREPPRLRR